MTFTLISEDDAAAHDRVAHTGEGKTVAVFKEDGVIVSSRFDGGNLSRADRVGEDCYDLHVHEDAGKGRTGYTTWFYFQVSVRSTDERASNALPRTLQFSLVNMNPQRGLYHHGYSIMYRSTNGMNACDCPHRTAMSHDDGSCGCPSSCWEGTTEMGDMWDRITTPLQFETVRPNGISKQEECSTRGKLRSPTKRRQSATSLKGSQLQEWLDTRRRITFTYTIQHPHHEVVRFAFCYPYSFDLVQRQLSQLDTTLGSNTHSNTSDSMYYHRDVLTRSLQGIRVDILTLSSRRGILATHPPTLPAQFDCHEKRTVIISARVHPGETPANFMLDGMIHLLTSSTDPRAVALRDHFVFKIIPVLNPDGVCQGHYRTDTRGVNLNRVYEQPDANQEPAVYALKTLITEITHDYRRAGVESPETSVVYIDLHAHANRRGCFFFGNNFMEKRENQDLVKRQIQTQLLAKLVGLYSPFFDYAASSFDKSEMSKQDLRANGTATASRSGSSRVALYKATGLTHVYTLECNYNEGRQNTSVIPARSDIIVDSKAGGKVKGASQSLQKARLYTKFTPESWRDVGTGAVLALLDLFYISTGTSRISSSTFGSIDAIRKDLRTEVQQSWGEMKSKRESTSNKSKI